MKIKRTIGERIFDCVNVLIMCGLIAVMLYPIWYVFVASLSDSNKLLSQSGLLFLPIDFSLKAYGAVFKNGMILTGYKNTLFILFVSLAIQMTLTTIAAYCLSRKNLYLGKLITKLIIVTMYINGGLVATYLLVTRTLGLNDSLWAVILPAGMNTYNFIIMRTSISQMPESLIESARLDGANHAKVLLRIVVPTSMPIISVMILYYAVATWNAWFNASIYLHTRANFPVQLVLREILIQNDTATMSGAAADDYAVSEAIKYAVIIITTVPILCVYPYLQKYFTKGIMVGAVKG